MKLSDVLTEDLILPFLKGTDVSSVLREFADSVGASGQYADSNAVYDRLMESESQESTGIGNGSPSLIASSTISKCASRDWLL